MPHASALLSSCRGPRRPGAHLIAPSPLRRRPPQLMGAEAHPYPTIGYGAHVSDSPHNLGSGNLGDPGKGQVSKPLGSPPGPGKFHPCLECNRLLAILALGRPCSVWAASLTHGTGKALRTPSPGALH